MCDLRAIAMRYADEVWNGRRMEVVDELFTEGHRYHDPALPDLPTGPEGVRRRVETYLGAVPDAIVTIEDTIIDGDRIAARWSWGGTNTGEILGMPPTGRSASITGCHLFRFEGDRIAETWAFADTLGLLTQLGLAQIGPVPATVAS
ncbi:MAG TPA: ester cyclase [Miltoncostaeaceae bacterium]|nr:ester cyclase [Miltoncostaeaceae bacterium]